MKLVYTSENRLIVSNARNIVSAAGIEVMLKNEFAAGGLGELSAFDTWLQLWVVNDSDYLRACQLIEDSLSEAGAAEWTCDSCLERNDPAFETCWKCQRDRPLEQPLAP